MSTGIQEKIQRKLRSVFAPGKNTPPEKQLSCDKAPEDGSRSRPAPAPYKLERWVEITTNIGCPNRCLYCPQDSLIQSYHPDSERPAMMSLETFKTILYHIPKHIDICFTGMSEPLSNPQCMDMLRYSCDAGFHTHLYTTFRDCSPEMVAQLGALPIVTYVIHLPDADGMMRLQVDSGYLAVLSAFQALELPNVTYMTIGRLHEDIKQIMRHPVNESRANLRAGHLDAEVEARLKANHVPCYSKTSNPFPADKPVFCSRRKQYSWGDTARTHPECSIVLPDGSLVLCCMDWDMRHYLGNLREDNYENIMHGQAMARIEQSMRCGNQDPILCRQCEYASGTE